MAQSATAEYQFGDLLALARLSWTRAMAAEVARRGFEEYRLSDAATLRLLRRREASVGELGELLGTTRQAARKAVSHLERRGFARVRTDPRDARRLVVGLTGRGEAYAEAVVAAIATLNRSLARRVDSAELSAADAVLRRCIEPGLARLARRIAPPGGSAG